ncbi:unknown protein [Microcystis aeruginosa NIES-843]|uniref:Uncharacterized protein n=1 Tax=Microcystis aeruginosa (strain NIES-843 / IAM M-2473) TaxID=449447 RepID=B0JTG4_MICAN|nr:unknown protein [Microcystis aeruginosa NIES-843]
MSQGLKNFKPVFMLGQKKGRKSLEIDKENEEKERTLSLVEEREKKTLLHRWYLREA